MEEKENFIKIEDEDKIDYEDSIEEDESENEDYNVLPFKIYVDIEGKLQDLLKQSRQNNMHGNENRTDDVKSKSTAKNNDDKIKSKKEKKGILNKFFKN